MFLSSCYEGDEESCEIPQGKVSIANDYAELFTIIEGEEGINVLKIHHPEGGAPDQEFIVVDGNKSEYENCSNAIAAPVKRMVIFSASHAYMIDTLGSVTSIKAFPTSNYTANPRLLDQMKSGHTKEIGELTSADIEALILMEPDLVMVSGGDTENAKVEQLRKAGIPVIENVEWRESHPLGRAEWIKVFGLLCGKEQLASQVFEGVLQNYLGLSEETVSRPKASRIIYGKNTGSTWYIPGRQSYIAKLFEDAQIPYPWPDNEKSGSIPMDMEAIVSLQFNDSLWVGPGVSSLEELAEADERHQGFQAYKQGNVFQYDKRKGPNGVTWYWEQSVLRCDLLLKDLMTITALGADDGSSLYFYRKLDE